MVVEPRDGICTNIGRDMRCSLSPSGEDAARRSPSVNQEESPHQNLTVLLDFQPLDL